jgi:hypothetical protein
VTFNKRVVRKSAVCKLDLRIPARQPLVGRQTRAGQILSRVPLVAGLMAYAAVRSVRVCAKNRVTACATLQRRWLVEYDGA